MMEDPGDTAQRYLGFLSQHKPAGPSHAQAAP